MTVPGRKMDSDIIENTEIQRLPLTQDDGNGKSKIKYGWIILFEKNVNVSKPFTIVKLRDFLNTDFPWKRIWDEMTKECRLQTHVFSSLFPGKEYFLFAKVQYGEFEKTMHICHLLRPSRPTNLVRNRQTNGPTDRPTNTRTDKQTDRPTNTQTDKLT